MVRVTQYFPYRSVLSIFRPRFNFKNLISEQIPGSANNYGATLESFTSCLNVELLLKDSTEEGSGNLVQIFA